MFLMFLFGVSLERFVIWRLQILVKNSMGRMASSGVSFRPPECFWHGLAIDIGQTVAFLDTKKNTFLLVISYAIKLYVLLLFPRKN